MRLRDYLKEVRDRAPFKRQVMGKVMAQVNGKLGTERVLDGHHWRSSWCHHEDLGKRQVSPVMRTSLGNSLLWGTAQGPDCASVWSRQHHLPLPPLPKGSMCPHGPFSKLSLSLYSSEALFRNHRTLPLL